MGGLVRIVLPAVLPALVIGALRGVVSRFAAPSDPGRIARGVRMGMGMVLVLVAVAFADGERSGFDGSSWRPSHHLTR